LPPKLVLASSSPRRRRLLSELGLDYTVRPPDTDETPLPGEEPAAMVERLARDKALARVEAGEVVVAADTTVAIDGEILGKPVDAADARRMLARIAGREHVVYTGVAVATRDSRGDAPRTVVRVARTMVRMRALSEAEIAAYVATGEPLDKAGSYAIQELGSLLVEGITGDFTNVVGLPLPTVAACFEDLGLRLLDFRK
jgi:septum formation protein